MRPVKTPLRAVAGAALAVTLLAGCGQRDNLIPASDARVLQQSFDSIAAALEDGRCDQLGAMITEAQELVAGLPRSVDARLRRRIQQGIVQLSRTAPRDCREQTTTETVPTVTETTPTTETVPTVTETTPTVTTPTVPETTPTTPTVTTPTTPTPTTPTVTTPPPSGGTPSGEGGGGASPDEESP